jgi:hypothetical protein
MSGRLRLAWLPRLLFRLTLGVSAVLVVVVLAAPLVDYGGPQPAGGWRLVAVCARDAALRRTAVASAIGLAVTACVFFRPEGAPGSAGRRPKSPRTPPPPAAVVGA